MDRNRKILLSILSLLVLSAVIAIVDVSLTMQRRKGRPTAAFTSPAYGPGVGIVRIDGPIYMNGQRSPLGMTSGAQQILKRLNDLEADPDIKAIVVRINSPGGTVSATQEIFEKLMRMRKKNIKLVASLGEIAASGGYYVASACECIVANHGTITGSIGVIAMSPNLRKLFEKLGVGMNVIKSGRYKDMLSSYRDLSGDERALLQQMIDASYKKFLKDVARGRNQNQSDIEPYADGRIMIGATAQKLRLVDNLGTFEDAIDKAREIAELPGDSPVYDEVVSPIEQFLMGLESIFRARSPFERNPVYDAYDSYYKLEYRYMK